MNHAKLCCGLLLLSALSSLANSAPILFSDQNAFFDSLPGVHDVVNQDFESLDAFGSRVGGGISVYDLPYMSLVSDLPAIKLLDRTYSGSRNTTPEGRQYLSIDTDLRRRGTQTEFVLSSNVLAVGFNLIDHDADDAQLLFDDASILIPEVEDGESVFLGMLFNPLENPSMRFTLDIGRDSQVALDDFVFILRNDLVQVSEPANLGLLSVALLMLFGFKRHSFRQKM